MSAPQTLRFAGSEAAVGLVVMTVFALVLGAVAAGLGLVWYEGLLPGAGISMLAGAAVLGAVAALLGWQVVRDWQRFRTLDIQADGTWHLRNPFGALLFSLAPGDKRAVDSFERHAWLFLGTPRRAHLSWLQIELPDGRVFRSARSTAKFQAPALDALQAHIQERHGASAGAGS